jgi:basic amino acid/polyamine antiporter, APA family
MARDGLFFERVGRLSPRTGAPVVAIVLQGVLATAIACSGRYEQILNYEVSVDFLAFTLAALALYRLRREGRGNESGALYLTPGYPLTPALFALVCLAVVASTILADPANSLMAIVIMLAGLPVYWYWRRSLRARTPHET